MKILIASFLILLLSLAATAQSPSGFKYQAIVRDNTGESITAQVVSLRIGVLKGSTTGGSSYIETHNVTTSDFGLVDLVIGEGSVVDGDFTTIDWGNDNYFLRLEVDENGGSDYTLLGTTQLLSVPYALYAEVAGNVKLPKIISGTISSDQITSIAHELDATEIAGILVTIKDTSNDQYIAQPYNVYQAISYWYDDTNFYIDRNLYDLIGEPFKVTIFLGD